MFITKYVNCKKHFTHTKKNTNCKKKNFKGKVSDYIEHLIAEYALQKQNTKSLYKAIYVPYFLCNPYFKEVVFYSFQLWQMSESSSPTLIRGGDFHYEHILLFMQI